MSLIRVAASDEYEQGDQPSTWLRRAAGKIRRCCLRNYADTGAAAAISALAESRPQERVKIVGGRLWVQIGSKRPPVARMFAAGYLVSV